MRTGARRPCLGLVRYGAGNTGAVASALEAAGAQVRPVDGPADLDAGGLDALVLPGVGAMAPAVEALRARGLWRPLLERAVADMPLLGVCLGMQLLFGPSAEGGAGLGLLPGETVRLEGVRVPHLGWAQVRPAAGAALFAAWPEPAYVYFAHSYGVAVVDDDLVAARTVADVRGAGGGIVAAVSRPPLFGVQFHPERSQGAGMAVLEAFCDAAVAA